MIRAINILVKSERDGINVFKHSKNDEIEEIEEEIQPNNLAHIWKNIWFSEEEIVKDSIARRLYLNFTENGSIQLLQATTDKLFSIYPNYIIYTIPDKKYEHVFFGVVTFQTTKDERMVFLSNEFKKSAKDAKASAAKAALDELFKRDLVVFPNSSWQSFFFFFN
jgi:hypothetical protein